MTMGFGPSLNEIGLAGYWNAVGLPDPSGSIFKTCFHIAVGLGMALVYAFAVEPRLSGPAWIKGLWYALILWVMNASIILPLIGEGIAGVRHLNFAGVFYYACARTVSFVLLALWYEKFILKKLSANSSINSARRA